jgi:hypothetical protein
MATNIESTQFSYSLSSQCVVSHQHSVCCSPLNEWNFHKRTINLVNLSNVTIIMMNGELMS